MKDIQVPDQSGPARRDHRIQQRHRARRGQGRPARVPRWSWPCATGQGRQGVAEIRRSTEGGRVGRVLDLSASLGGPFADRLLERDRRFDLLINKPAMIRRPAHHSGQLRLQSAPTTRPLSPLPAGCFPSAQGSARRVSLSTARRGSAGSTSTTCSPSAATARSAVRTVQTANLLFGSS